MDRVPAPQVFSQAVLVSVHGWRMDMFFNAKQTFLLSQVKKAAPQLEEADQVVLANLMKRAVAKVKRLLGSTELPT